MKRPHASPTDRRPWAWVAFTRGLRMKVDYVNPPGLCPTFGWTHVAAITGGKTVYISGQVAVDARGEVVGKGDLKRQTEQAFENIRIALEAVGGTFRDVVKTSLFV